MSTLNSKKCSINNRDVKTISISIKKRKGEKENEDL
jgi:hypothetical protein